MKYDYLIVGAGLFGATFAHLAKKAGKTCIVIDKRNHIGGNLYCEEMHGITVHMYGPHIFHTNNKYVYDFVTSLVNVHPYCHQPIAMYNDKLYNLPFNMNTFYQMWGVKTEQEARNIIKWQSNTILNSVSLRDKAISMVCGAVMSGEIKRHERAYEIASKITKELELDGNMCFDFIIDDDAAYLLEVNPRINATLPFVQKAGANLAYLRCLQLLGHSIIPPKIKYGIKMKKYYESEYFF